MSTCKGVLYGLFISEWAGLVVCRRLLIGGAPAFSLPLMLLSNLSHERVIILFNFVTNTCPLSSLVWVQDTHSGQCGLHPIMVGIQVMFSVHSTTLNSKPLFGSVVFMHAPFLHTHSTVSNAGVHNGVHSHRIK